MKRDMGMQPLVQIFDQSEPNPSFAKRDRLYSLHPYAERTFHWAQRCSLFWSGGNGALTCSPGTIGCSWRRATLRNDCLAVCSGEWPGAVPSGGIAEAAGSGKSIHSRQGTEVCLRKALPGKLGNCSL